MKIIRISPILFAALLAAALASGCGKKTAAARTEAAPALAIRAQAAAERTFERRLTVQGTLEARNYANVAARIDGNLEEIWVEEGDPVVAGKTALFQIDSVNRQSALAIAEQNLAMALKLAERALVLDHGSVVFDGPSDILMADKDFQKEHLGL